MKPTLVNYKELLSQIKPHKPNVPKTIVPKMNVNNKIGYSFLFNIFGILFLLVGIYLLYNRNMNKDKSEEEYIEKINILKEITEI